MNRLLLVLFLLSVSSSFGAVIHGTVYDMDLNKVQNGIIEVDTTPKQRFVILNGSYSFDVPKGEYSIKASYIDENSPQSTIEDIKIIDEGVYVLDLFLFIDISDEREILNESGLEIILPYDDKSPNYVLYSIILFILILIILFFRYHKKVKPTIRNLGKITNKTSNTIDKSDTQKIIKILKSHGGRANQKDIRKELPLSEAKISLLLSELESEGTIKRIKKGRGNIIILQ